jgi:hypothetical protein
MEVSGQLFAQDTLASGKEPMVFTELGVFEPKSNSGYVEEEENLLPLPRIEHHTAKTLA